MMLPESSLSQPVIDDNDDVPVNRTLSFNGRLNKYFHRVTKNEGIQTTTEIKSFGDESASSSSSLSESLSLKRKLEHENISSGREGRTTRSRPATPSTTRLTRSRSQILAASSSSSSSVSSSSISSKSTTKKKRSARSARTTPATPILPSLLRDTIPSDLILLLVGVNPGLMTGTTGFAYAHPSNLFWKLLHSSGITAIRHPPSDTYRLPELYEVGNTNIVERPTRDASMLTKAEMDAGVPVLEAKVAAQRPEAVCLVGKSIWEAVWRVRKGRAIKKEEFKYGWQDKSENMGRVRAGDGTESWNGAPVFVATTTSGLAAGMTLAEKQAVWNELGRWVVQRRQERKAAASNEVDKALDSPTQADVEIPEGSTTNIAGNSAEFTTSLNVVQVVER
ncbi:uracil DNA glycosylase superfamily protein [Paecilomyces variotii No. 5]|uniref:Uracil DNA glycosylase superfamily protein n=1 Tax=Byssochlamys spectabilis (strain No. 5 / NBRC 109023) TaxID=1356009 RepID=V5FM50_BYSSN|nr:uracil DNA glycosylase superfamily protein [Paecilomyces variotii No. 5]